MIEGVQMNQREVELILGRLRNRPAGPVFGTFSGLRHKEVRQSPSYHQLCDSNKAKVRAVRTGETEEAFFSDGGSFFLVEHRPGGEPSKDAGGALWGYTLRSMPIENGPTPASTDGLERILWRALCDTPPRAVPAPPNEWTQADRRGFEQVRNGLKNTHLCVSSGAPELLNYDSALGKVVVRAFSHSGDPGGDRDRWRTETVTLFAAVCLLALALGSSFLSSRSRLREVTDELSLLRTAQENDPAREVTNGIKADLWAWAQDPSLDSHALRKRIVELLERETATERDHATQSSPEEEAPRKGTP